MLPIIPLPSPQPLSVDSLQDAAPLLPQDADVLEGRFADILALRVDERAPDVSGEPLPTIGNPLPLLPQELVLESATRGTARESAAATEPSPLRPLSVQQALTAAAGVRADGPLPASAASAAVAVTRPAPTQVLPQPVAVPPGPPAGDAAADETGITNRAIPGVADEAFDPDLAVRLQQPASRDRRPGAAAPPAPAVPPTRADVPVTQTLQAVDRAPMPILEADVRRSPDVRPLLERALDRSAPRPEIPLSAATADETKPAVRPITTVLPASAGAGLEFAAASDVSARPAAEVSAPLVRMATGPDATLPTSTRSIELPVQQPGWDTAIAERVTMMAGGKVQNADIRLSPAELGPLRVQVSVDDGQAHVVFQAQHAITRDALELAMPRLREMLADQGLTLGQATITDHDASPGGREAWPQQDGRRTTNGPQAEPEPARDDSGGRREPDGLVDTFA